MSYSDTSVTPTNSRSRSTSTSDDCLSVRSYGSATLVGTPSESGSTYKTPTPSHVAAMENTPLLGSGNSVPRPQPWRASLKEAWVLLRYAAPVVCTSLIEYSLVITSIIIVGHLSTEKLAGASLGSMTAGVTGFSIIQGFACALDSLLPAAWTGAHPSHVGLWTQRMFVLMACLLVPVSIVWLNVEHIFLYLRQDPEVAKLGAIYLRHSLFQLPPYAFNAVIRRYFQAQGLLHIPSLITLTTAPINVGLNYLLVWGPDSISLGFVGAPIATTISLALMSTLYTLYAIFFASRKAWHPISIQSFCSLPKLLRLALTGVGQSAAEWWSWEFISLAASQLGPVTLAAQSVLVMTSSTTYQIPYALGVASSVRIGNLLGAGSVSEVMIASRVAAVLSLLGGIVSASIFMVARHKIAYLYTNDDEIASLVAVILPLVATYQIVDGLAAVTAGMLRACGKLGTGAISNFVGYYFIGIPLGVYLTFWQGFGLKGLWIGLAAALLFVATILWTTVLGLDWQVQVKEAKERVEDRMHLEGELERIDDETAFDPTGHRVSIDASQTIRSGVFGFNATLGPLSSAIESYSSACTALHTICSPVPRYPAPNIEFEDALAMVDSKLEFLASEERKLHDIRISLAALRNRSMTLAPVNKLPPEILGNIFALSKSYCIFDRKPDHSYSGIASVCSHWRLVALEKTDLWTHVDVDDGIAAGLSSLLFERTRDSPVHLHIHESAVDAFKEHKVTKMINLIMPHIYRVCSLDIKSRCMSNTLIQATLDAWLNHGDETLARFLSIERPMFSTFLPYTTAPNGNALGNAEKILLRLTELRLGTVQFDWHSGAYRGLIDLRLESRYTLSTPVSLPELYDVLSASPALVTLKLAWLNITLPQEWVQPSRIILKCLKLLSLHRMEPKDLKLLLPLITLPDLSDELGVSLLAHSDISNGLAELLGRSRVTTLYITAHEIDNKFLLQLPTRSLVIPPKLVFAHFDLDTVIDQLDSALPQLSSLGLIPHVILHESTVSFQSLERLVTRHGIRNLRLAMCSTDHPQDLQDIRSSLLEIYPELEYCISDTPPTELEVCHTMFHTF